MGSGIPVEGNTCTSNCGYDSINESSYVTMDARGRRDRDDARMSGMTYPSLCAPTRRRAFSALSHHAPLSLQRVYLSRNLISFTLSQNLWLLPQSDQGYRHGRPV